MPMHAVVPEAAAVPCAQVLMRYQCEVLGAGGQATVHKTVIPFAVKGVSSPILATGTTTPGSRMKL